MPDLASVLVVLNLQHSPRKPADGTKVYRGLGTSTKVALRAGQTGYLALYSYAKGGSVSPAGPYEILARGADPAAPAHGQCRAYGCRCSAGSPSRAARTTTCSSTTRASACCRLALARVVSAPGRRTRARYLCLVRLAGRQERGSHAEVLEPDRARDVHLPGGSHSVRGGYPLNDCRGHCGKARRRSSPSRARAAACARLDRHGRIGRVCRPGVEGRSRSSSQTTQRCEREPDSTLARHRLRSSVCRRPRRAPARGALHAPRG